MSKLTGKNALITGDGGTFTVNAGFDLSGYTLRFTVKPESALSANTDAGAIMQLTYVCPVNADTTAGIARIPYTSTDTRVTPGKYVFDVQFNKTGIQPFSSRKQEIEFTADVTKS